MSTLQLTPYEPDKLKVYVNLGDVRRDLHTFISYVKDRSIKRSVRGNQIPTADYNRLAKLMSFDERETAEDRAGYSRWAGVASWIDYVDWLALRLGFVSYDTKGEYRGYSSTEPSFRENYIEFNANSYHKFLTLPIAEQERRLLDLLLHPPADPYGYRTNEFYQPSIMGRLDRFPQAGSATGVMPLLDFAEIRRFLFDVLQSCEPGTWYSTASLISYLKAKHRYFLIPEEIPKPPPSRYTRQVKRGGKLVIEDPYPPSTPSRYGNFYEDHYTRKAIPDDAPDGFERVEGRYIERFLEDIPLTLGYVEVAYSPPPEKLPEYNTPLSRGLLTAFRTTERLGQALSGDIPEPKVTIQPNFEIYIESPFYPAYLISRLNPLTDLIREDTTTILKLNKQKVATQLAENEGLDVIDLLTRLSGKKLPQNVVIEMEEWAGHADVFTLYDGFGVVEFQGKPPAADSSIVEEISGSMRLVRQPGEVFARLRKEGAVVIGVQHSDNLLALLPEKAHTVFPRKTPPTETPKRKSRQSVTVKRETMIALHFPDDDLFERFRKALLDAKCIFDANREGRTLTIPGQYEAHIKEAIKVLRDDYAIKLEDLQ